MKVTQVVTLYSACSRRIAAGAVATLESAWVAYQKSHGYRDNSIAIPLPVATHAAGGVNGQIPDNQTTHTAPFDTVAHINSISQVVLRIPQFLPFTGVYRKIGLTARLLVIGTRQSPCPQSRQRRTRRLCMARNRLAIQHTLLGHIARNQLRGRHIEIGIARAEAADGIG